MPPNPPEVVRAWCIHFLQQGIDLRVYMFSHPSLIVPAALAAWAVGHELEPILVQVKLVLTAPQIVDLGWLRIVLSASMSCCRYAKGLFGFAGWWRPPVVDCCDDRCGLHNCCGGTCCLGCRVCKMAEVERYIYTPSGHSPTGARSSRTCVLQLL